MLDYPVYDADRHFYEPPEAFLRHLPKKFAKNFQYVQINGRTKLAVGGVITEYIPNPTFEVVAAPGSHEKWFRGDNPQGLSLRELQGPAVKSEPAFHDGAAHLKAMDAQGIHAGLVLPTLASVIEERLLDKPASVGALFHALNQWLVDDVGLARDSRLFPVPMVSLADLDGAVRETDFLLKNGARVIGIRPAPVPGIHGSRSMGLKEFDPFWARVAEAGIFVVLHVSDSGYDRIYRWWTGGSEWLPFEKDAFQEVLDSMGRAIADSLAAIICHGVFDRHPRARVASLENGSAWVEPLLKRLALAHHKLPQQFSRDPLETFRQHVWVAPFYEDAVSHLAKLVGVEHILFGSDWPHAEGLATPLSFLNDIGDLDADATRKVMSSNLKHLLEGVR
jgi:predicted TIM-barrel fold metal-dependent hydrolase